MRGAPKAPRRDTRSPFLITRFQVEARLSRALVYQTPMRVVGAVEH
jgi:hypothetical protein